MWQDSLHARKRLNISEEKLDRIIKVMERRHPKENWIGIRHALNDQETIYLRIEFVDWIDEVYLKDGYYLDLEIAFYKKLILNLEQELGIEHKERQYENISQIDLRKYFNKSKNVIGVATTRMQKEFSYPLKYLKDGKVFITAEGVKWLSEKYFRTSYLKELEEYKLKLTQIQELRKKFSNIKEPIIIDS